MAQEDEGSKFTWFLMGAALGAAAALLYAPKSGKETRQLLQQKAQEATDAVSDAKQEIYQRSKEAIDRGKQAVDDAAALFDRARGLSKG